MVDAPAPALMRQKSTVPTSTNNTESTVLKKPIQEIWKNLREFKLEALAPGKVETTSWTDGAPGTVGGLVEVTYKNGSKWLFQITELSDKHHSISYRVVVAEPAMEVSSLEGDIQLRRVTSDDPTFLSWCTDFSNDADAEIIQDQKFKKLDFFAEAESQ